MNIITTLNSRVRYNQKKTRKVTESQYNRAKEKNSHKTKKNLTGSYTQIKPKF